MKLTGIRAVTFDAAGTLLEAHPSVGAIYAEVAAAHGVVLGAEELNRRFRAAFRARSAQPRPRTNEAAERRFWEELVREVFHPEAGAGVLGRVFPALWETFAESRRWRPRDGAEEALASLHARGLPVAVLSNWDARLHRVIDGLGWRGRLRGVFISSELGAEKPDRAIFDAVATRLGCPPAALLHVGDSPRHDAAGALAAGWRAALVGAGHDGAVSVSSLREIPALLA